MNKMLEKLKGKVRSIATGNGENQTVLPFLKIYKSVNSKIQMPTTEVPYIYLVLDGEMRLHTPSGIMDYIAGQYSVSAIDTPTSGDVLSFSKQQDFLALALTFTLDDVLSVMLNLDDDLTIQIAEGTICSEITDKADHRIIETAYNLVCTLDQPIGLSFMGKHIKQEIIYYVLCGSCGKQFLQSMIHIQQAGEIYEINSWIKQNYRNTFTVEELAEKNSMSVSHLHQKFKSAVGMGVLQCQKRLRLTEARRLMLDENKNVTEASLDVGYESVSQFIREYRKMFGQSPKEDIIMLQKRLQK